MFGLYWEYKTRRIPGPTFTRAHGHCDCDHALEVPIKINTAANPNILMRFLPNSWHNAKIVSNSCDYATIPFSGHFSTECSLVFSYLNDAATAEDDGSGPY